LDFAETEELRGQIISRGLFRASDLEDCKSVPALIDFVFKRKIRDNIVQPSIVYNYPSVLVPLARRSDDDPRRMDFFQAIAVGSELCKAYSELVDPLVQRAELVGQLENRDAGDEESFDIDEGFLTAMEHGFPPQSGLGFGIDRLMMILADQPNVRDVILFPMMK
jgi:lysyl-tRNA synthetase class 2